jgi:transcriptional regulator with GAF, ATPase, and Fis domain
LKSKLEAESRYLQQEIRAAHDFDEIIGSSSLLLATLDKTKVVSATHSTVLLLGETGTGKELLARAIHARSARKDRPLIKVDCGNEKGAFTGAHESKTGRFELANGGTIFLDEIGDLPLDLQPKLLRAIEDGVIQRVGGTDEKHVDVRVIVATNRDLEAAIDQGRFRSDLYYRISVFPIESPPLRERRDDIPLLVSFFVSRYAGRIGKPIDSVSQSSMDALVAYDWPGNVRELRNVIERSVILCASNTLDVTEALGAVPSPSGTPSSGLKRDLLAVERSRIVRALEESGWKIKGAGNAAERLGVTPSTLRSKMKKLDIARPLPPASTPLVTDRPAASHRTRTPG